MAERRFSATRLPGFATIAMLAFLALYIPILTLVVYSFNSEVTMGNWGDLTLAWYGKAWANADVKDATLRSLTIVAEPDEWDDPTSLAPYLPAAPLPDQYTRLVRYWDLACELVKRALRCCPVSSPPAAMQQPLC